MLPGTVRRRQQGRRRVPADPRQHCPGFRPSVAALNLNTARSGAGRWRLEHQALLGVKDVQEALSVQAATLAQPNVGGCCLSRSVHEISTQTQGRVRQGSGIAVRRVPEVGRRLLDKAASAPAGLTSPSLPSKSAIAAANSAFDSMNKAAKQKSPKSPKERRAATNATVKAVGATAAAGKKKAA